MSEVAICSQALALIGAEPIQSLVDDPGNESVRVCNAFYASTRDQVLQEFTWNFATKMTSLAATTDPTNDERWAIAYALPVGVLQPIAVYPKADYLIRGNRLLSNAQNLSLEYVFRETDTTRFSSQFTQALVYLLASLIAYPLGRDNQKVQELYGLYQQVLARGKSNDTLANPERSYISDDLLRVRW